MIFLEEWKSGMKTHKIILIPDITWWFISYSLCVLYLFFKMEQQIIKNYLRFDQENNGSELYGKMIW